MLYIIVQGKERGGKVAIPKTFITRLLDNSDIYDIASSYMVVKRAGRTSKGVCPFHNDKTPSLTIYSDTQSFYCFGCGAGGDVISFIMKAENLDYIEAIHFLAQKQGLVVPEDVEDKQGKLKERLYQINKEAARFFHKCLLAPDGKIGRDYFENRGLSDKIISTYGLGYAPNSFDLLTKYLVNKGYSKEELAVAAVVGVGKKGNYYDYFRNRVMFPIIDIKGRVIGFGARVLDDSKPKYLNTPDTLVFKKSNNLFSLNLAKKATIDTIILAEGYMDVIAVYAAGFTNVVATLGTAITSEQARIIAKYAKQVVIAYDADSAGQKAVHRAMNLFSEVGIPTRILNMNGAKDPDEYIRKFGAVRFEKLIDGATDVVEYELQSLLKQIDIGTAQGKIDYTNKAVKILSQINDKVAREVYAAGVSEQVNISTAMLTTQAATLSRRSAKQSENKMWRSLVSSNDRIIREVNIQKKEFVQECLAEEGIIAFLFLHPDRLAYIDSKITEQEFVTDFNRRVFSFIRQKVVGELNVLISDLNEEFAVDEVAYITGVVAKTHENDGGVKALDDYISILKEFPMRQKQRNAAELSEDELRQMVQGLQRQKGRQSAK